MPRNTDNIGVDRYPDWDNPKPPSPARKQEKKEIAAFVAEAAGHKTLAVALASLRGRDLKFDDVHAHGFHSKPVVKAPTPEGGELITGHLSHMLNGLPDDQLHFQIFRQGTVITKIERRFDQGGWGAVVAALAPVVSIMTGVPIPPEAVGGLVHRIETAVHGGDWISVADAIVLQIALRA